MNPDNARRNPLALAALAAMATAAALIFLLSGGSEDSVADQEPPSSPEFSVMTPATPEAEAALPDKAQEWIAGMERSSLAITEAEALTALASTDTAEGEIVLADFGRNVCAFSVVRGVSLCGTSSLLNEGKLVAAVPGCGSAVVIGLVPDEVIEVRVEAGNTGEGDTEPSSIPVSSNVFTAELASVETVLSGVTDSGVAYDAELPLANTPSAC